MLGKKDSESLLGKLLDQIQLKPKIAPVKSGYIGNPHQMAKQSIMHYLAPMHKCLENCPHVVYFRFQSCVWSGSGSRISTHQEHTMGTQLQTQSNPWQSSPVLLFNESVSCGYLVIVCFLQNLLWPCEEPAAFATTWWHSCKTHWAQTNTPFLFAGFWEESRDTMNIATLGSWGLWFGPMNFDGTLGYFCVATESKTFIFTNSWATPKAFLFCVGWNWPDPWWSICAWWLPYQMYREFFTLSKSGHVMAMWNTRGSPSGQNCSLYWSQEIL